MIQLEEKVDVLDWAVGLGTIMDMVPFDHTDPKSRDNVKSKKLLCPHLYRDQSPTQHPRSSCCTRLEDRALDWKSATNGQYFLCWSLNVKVYRPYYLFAAVYTHPDTNSFLYLITCVCSTCVASRRLQTLISFRNVDNDKLNVSNVRLYIHQDIKLHPPKWLWTLNPHLWRTPFNFYKFCLK